MLSPLEDQRVVSEESGSLVIFLTFFFKVQFSFLFCFINRIFFLADIQTFDARKLFYEIATEVLFKAKYFFTISNIKYF